MKFNRKITGIVAALLCGATMSAVFAQDEIDVSTMSTDEIISMRQDLMKENGQTLRSARELTGEDASQAMQTVLANYQALPDLFPEGSTSDDSDALPAIWENWDAFIEIVDAGTLAAEDAIAAADAGDNAAYMAAFQRLGGTCGQCHQQFRAEDN
ncbi:cytochrome c-556 [Devosia pacifica]|uniref:Cytochrome c-556 n=1 Tax=Devosia pacifica TaxID=1335967 RepID=A0A918SA44_9HYPH|nr:cytochrome c [Devosia pacifica]GHA28928.1 cytochrome c-556 [Devosia pacifica]